VLVVQVCVVTYVLTSDFPLPAPLCPSSQDPLEVLDVYDQLAHVAETFGVFGYMSVFHEVVLRRWLPVGGKQFRQLDRRLHINVTRFICRYV